jgi:uncharacterized protein YndB with AHSA1/START domain
MTGIPRTAARAVADLHKGQILASVEIAAPPERVFGALTSKEIIDWWGLPGVFDTQEWTGDVRNGGRWRASGVVRGQSYTLEGEFLEVRPPTRLVHTWQRVGAPGASTIVTYYLEPIVGGTRLTIHHTGFVPPGASLSTCQGWEASLQQLASALSGTVFAASGGSGPATPQARAISYFEALQRKDGKAIRQMLVDDGDFIGPLQSFNNADAFMEAAEVFMKLVKSVNIKRVLTNCNDVCVLWNYRTIIPSMPVIPVAAWLKIEADKIKYFHLHFNPAAFVAAAERGEVAEALSGAERK